MRELQHAVDTPDGPDMLGGLILRKPVAHLRLDQLVDLLMIVESFVPSDGEFQ